MKQKIFDLCDEYLACDKLERECSRTIDTARKRGHDVVHKMLLKKSIGFSDRMVEIEKEVKSLSTK